eukprot:COSAG05_NODE_7752_length_773_cov_1.299703_1_plen_166_part_10
MLKCTSGYMPLTYGTNHWGCGSLTLGYVVPLGGHHHHQEDLINSIIYFTTLKSLFIYYLNLNPCTTARTDYRAWFDTVALKLCEATARDTIIRGRGCQDDSLKLTFFFGRQGVNPYNDLRDFLALETRVENQIEGEAKRKTTASKRGGQLPASKKGKRRRVWFSEN